MIHEDVDLTDGGTENSDRTVCGEKNGGRLLSELNPF